MVELEVKGYKDQKHKIPVCVTKAGGSYVTGVDVSKIFMRSSIFILNFDLNIIFQYVKNYFR